MKRTTKALLFIFLIVVGLCTISACALLPTQGETPHVHTVTTKSGIAPTCTDPGLTEGKYCSECKEVIKAQEILPPLGHTELILEAVAPTCTETGLSEGKLCTVCDGVLIEQRTIKALGHSKVTDKAVAPTCTESGITEGSHCSVCDEVFEKQEIVKPLGHNEVTDKAVAPTCTTTGLTEGSHCSNCDKVFTKQNTVDALGHSFGDWITVNEPTESQTGLKKRECATCGEKETEDIPLIPHDHSRWETIVLDAVAPTCTDTGLTEGKKCAKCGVVYVAQQIIPENGHDYNSEITSPTCLDRGYTTHTCHCGDTYVDSYVSALGHRTVKDPAVSPTCTEPGLTEGSHCSRCETVLVKQTEIAPSGHSYVLLKVPNGDGRCAVMCPGCGDVERYVDVIRYEDYGAVGDGVTDDSDAIRTAHSVANDLGLPVEGKANATYYIGVISQTIVVKTDTNWNGANFIFDDHQIRWDDTRLRNIQVFTVAPDVAAKTVAPSLHMVNNGLSKGQTNIGMTFSEPCMIRIENSNEKIYVRIGVNANSGANRNELILVDENGNVDPSTPIQYDYSTITRITVYSINEKPISVGNATFTTIAPNPKEYDPDFENAIIFFNRGLYVERSNTTIHDIRHIVENEMMTIEIDRNGDGVIDKWGADKSYGVSYNGFFNFTNAYNVTMQDCIVEGHQAYSFWQDLNGVSTRNEIGNYDITANNCVNLNMIRVKQYENEATGEVITNRFMYHGIMGTNWCRNTLLDDCYLDRFDVHQGMHNATLKNSTFGFGILVIGGGELYIENVTRISGTAFVHLRMDYNSVFDGDIIIKDCKMEPGIHSIVEGNWLEHNCGLPNYMTRSLTIDGLTVDRYQISLYNISGAKLETLNNSTNKLYLPERAEVNSVTRPNGSSVYVFASNNNDAFATITLEGDFPASVEHVWDDGVVISYPSTTGCTPGITRYTCTDCGITRDTPVASYYPHSNLVPSYEETVRYECSECGFCYSLDAGVHRDSDIVQVDGDNSHSASTENGYFEISNKGTFNGQHQIWVPGQTESRALENFTCENNAIGFLSFRINANDTIDDGGNNSGIEFKINANRQGNTWANGGGWNTSSHGIFKIKSRQSGSDKVEITGLGGNSVTSVTVTGSDGWSGWIDVVIMIRLTSDNMIAADYYINGSYARTISMVMPINTGDITSLYAAGRTQKKSEGYKLDDFVFGYTLGTVSE